MKVAIMQPYFFPYIGYFSLIKHTNLFVLLDEVQFIRHGWIERNRILKQNDGWLYIKAPLIKENSYPLILETKINNTQDWKNKILSQIQPYQKKAKHYYAIKKLLEDIFHNNFNTITEFNFYSLKKICAYLGISTPIQIFSEANIKIDPPNAPDEWALNICKKLNTVKEYWNPSGGKSFFDVQKYTNESIEVKFLTHKLPSYNQHRTTFEPGLSIIDVLMFNSIEETNQMLNDYTLESALSDV